MKFGEPSACFVDMANGFMVEQVKKTPWWNRIKYLAYGPRIHHDYL